MCVRAPCGPHMVYLCQRQSARPHVFLAWWACTMQSACEGRVVVTLLIVSPHFAHWKTIIAPRIRWQFKYLERKMKQKLQLPSSNEQYCRPLHPHHGSHEIEWFCSQKVVSINTKQKMQSYNNIIKDICCINLHGIFTRYQKDCSAN